MSKFWKFISLTAFLLSLFTTVAYLRSPQGKTTSHKETVFERVMKTGVIRCGYVVWEPYLSIDLQTGQKSGIAYDFMTALAEELALKVEWVEEVGWGNFYEGMNVNRYDVMCVPVWESGSRARAALLTRPLYDNGLYAFARSDDSRFDGDFSAINNPSVRIATIDGDVTQAVKQMRFPEAKELALSPMTDTAQMILSVAGRKADILFGNTTSVETYNEKASDKLKLVADGKPVRSFANSLAVKLGETDLKAAFDASIHAIIKNGRAEKIVEKYKGFSLPED